MQQIANRLAQLLDVNLDEIHQEIDQHASRADGIVKVGPFCFVVEWQKSGLTAPVLAAIEKIRARAHNIEKACIPLVAVPFMGEIGRQRCRLAEVSWLDLSGNARIFAPGLRILIEGKPNQYKLRGRPSSVFAPKSSRITRWLLMHPNDSITQRELAKFTLTDEGYTSKIVKKLLDDGFITRTPGGKIKTRDPGLLLDAWREAYRFDKHHIIKGHVAARSGDVLLQRLTERLSHLEENHAATGLAAAWLLDRFAGFRTVTLYLEREPTGALLNALSFREEERGANVWIVVPNDQGVFHGAKTVDGIDCVHPVQVYIDLFAHPERAKDASRNLRTNHLKWS